MDKLLGVHVEVVVGVDEGVFCFFVSVGAFELEVFLGGFDSHAGTQAAFFVCWDVSYGCGGVVVGEFGCYLVFGFVC